MPDDRLTAGSAGLDSTTAEARARAAPIVTWLMDEERVAPARMAPLLERFAGKLRQAGLPLDRASLHIQQLHPQLASRSLIWHGAGGGTKELDHEYSMQNRDVYLASPVKAINDGGAPIRRCLEEGDCALDFPVLEELKAQGLTDYSMHPMHFSGGAINAVSIATGRAGGFTELDIAILEAALPAFAAVTELQHQRRTARDLLSTYVGPNTGERIFSGAIRRGDGENIHAVLWYSDLRGFTQLSETQPLDQVIALLDAYFDAIAQPVVERGGEILKFIGDAMLAIFPCETNEAAVCGACNAAVAAAEAAVARVCALNETHRPEDGAAIECGVAVHLGEMMYGNIGAADRLDFTVIGPAVNLVSRLEDLGAQLGQPIVVSAALARTARREFRSLGHHALKGIAEKQEAFTLA